MRWLMTTLPLLCIMRGSPTASHNYYMNIMRKMSATFGRGLYACEDAIPVSNSLLTEFYFYWDKRHPLTNMFGCAVACISWKLGLMSKSGRPREENLKAFIRNHGGDQLMVYRFKELIFDCVQVIGKKRLYKPCIGSLEIAKCFRIGITYYHWAPELGDIYYDMTKTISRRLFNASDDKIDHTGSPKNSSLQFTSNNNVTTPESLNKSILHSSDNKSYTTIIINNESDQNTPLTKSISFPNNITKFASQTSSTADLLTQANSNCNKTDRKQQNSSDVSIIINATNEVKVDATYLKDIFDRFEERERERDLELISLYKDSLWFIRHHLDRWRSMKERRWKPVGKLDKIIDELLLWDHNSP